MNTFYFAYGSNMTPVRIRQRIPQARLVGKATIKGWRLVERLYADIERAKGRTVEGVLYLVSQTELYRLDSYEGYPHIYGDVQVDAWLDAQHKVSAFTYAMTEATKKEREGKEYPRSYRLICSTGAEYHGVKNEFMREGDPPFSYRGESWGNAPKGDVRKGAARLGERMPPLPILGGVAKRWGR